MTTILTDKQRIQRLEEIVVLLGVSGPPRDNEPPWRARLRELVDAIRQEEDEDVRAHAH